eukprot:TRINITY_DN3888_c4_g1_i6.p1 TRINITY_DN3888_c4_g1~~TRINITY_DN3888_c4_g1_i6.p1  ORF type:complete len:1106 (-),score=318.86 TRINITY_DN3888_c4_g1_i6:178-3450(-)
MSTVEDSSVDGASNNVPKSSSDPATMTASSKSDTKRDRDGPDERGSKKSRTEDASKDKVRTRDDPDKRDRSGSDKRPRDDDKESRDRPREKDRDRERDRDRDRDRQRERDRDRDRDREKERSKDKDRRDRDRDDRDKDRDKDRSRDRDRGRDRDRERDKDRGRDKPRAPPPPPLDPEEEKRREAERLDEEMKRRRERVEAWRRENKKEAQETEVVEEGQDGETETTKKGWSLEDDEDDEPITTKPDEKDSVTDEDPLEAFMLGVQTQIAQQAAAPPSHYMSGSKISRAAQSQAPKIMDSDDEALSDPDSEKEQEDDQDFLSKVLGKTKRKEMPAVDHAKMDYITFNKDFYHETPEIARMTEDEVRIMRDVELEGIKIKGKNCPKPVRTWVQCGLSNRILNVLERQGYAGPTPIQAQAIPAVMNGRDIIGIAKTGSGKTLAFLLPMLRHILDQPPIEEGEGPIGLIMAPTRELALQIFEECKKFTRPLGLVTLCVYGGALVGEQIADLKRGCDIVVCTPGRMIDMLCANKGKVVQLKRTSFVVLDEADRMFDLGFEPQIMKIIDNIRPDRQTIMFSATFPRSVELAARKILSSPLEVVVGGRSVVAAEIEQHVEVRAEETKFRRLLELMAEWYSKGCILIFVNRQEGCDKLFQQLMNANYPCLSLHGGMDQMDRDSTIADFKEHMRTVLVSTSLSARGLDVKDLNLVVNYDGPSHYEDYVHRVGRTGRAGNKGTAYTFLTPEEDKVAPEILNALKFANTTIPPELQQLADQYETKKKEGKVIAGGGGFGGKGYLFSEGEMSKKTQQKKAQRALLGMDDEDEKDKDIDEDEDEDLPEGVEVEFAVPAAAGTSAAATVPTAPAIPVLGVPAKPGSILGTSPALAAVAAVGSLVGPGAPALSPAGIAALAAVPVPAPTPAASSVGQQAVAQVTGGPGAPSAKPATISPAEAARRAAEIASKLSAAKTTTQKMQIMLMGPNGQPATGAAASLAMGVGQTGHFEDELEINDYPQQARFKVTYRDTVSLIHEYFGVVVTTRGTYVPPGKQAGQHRKLYLFLEGPTESSVRKAKDELKKLIAEASLTVGHTGGRYSVV